MLNVLRARARRRQLAGALCATLSRRAREPALFREFAVADTIDGRFDLLVLHAWLTIERLQTLGQHDLAQNLVDALFARFEEALREQGAGDMGIGRRMKKMASAFHGRLHAYSTAGDDGALSAALVRNVYRGDPSRVEAAHRLVKYALAARARLRRCQLGEGVLEFGPVRGPMGALSHVETSSRTIS